MEVGGGCDGFWVVVVWEWLWWLFVSVGGGEMVGWIFGWCFI